MTTHADYGAALLRISLGIAALAHGLILKVFTFGVAGTVGYFESIGYPGVVAYLVMFGEIAGGLALITGVYARSAAVLMIPILLGYAKLQMEVYPPLKLRSKNGYSKTESNLSCGVQMLVAHLLTHPNFIFMII